jgi:hypothetical protein
VTPRAVPTVAAVGHVLGAAVVVGSTGEAEATGDGDPAVVLPQAARAKVKRSRVSADRLELLNDMFTPAMVQRSRPVEVD